MAVTVKIEVLDRDFMFQPGSGMSPAEISAEFAAFAQSEIDAQSLANGDGQPTPYSTTVDGAIGRPLASVKAVGGVITAEFELVQDAVQWCLDALRQNSPHRDGDYQKSHTLFADGTEVQDPANLPFAAEYVILSTVPYARKIETGHTRNPESRWPAKGVYQVVAGMAARRFGNVAAVKFSFRSFEGGMHEYVPVVRPSARRGRVGSSPETRARAAKERANRQPALIITVR